MTTLIFNHTLARQLPLIQILELEVISMAADRQVHLATMMSGPSSTSNF